MQKASIPVNGAQTSQATIKVFVTTEVGRKSPMPDGTYAILFETSGKWFVQIVKVTNEHLQTEVINSSSFGEGVSGIVRGVTWSIANQVPTLGILTHFVKEVEAAQRHKAWPTLNTEIEVISDQVWFPMEFS